MCSCVHILSATQRPYVHVSFYIDLDNLLGDTQCEIIGNESIDIHFII